MASSVPAKSNPLHNFDLPHLKWKNQHSNNHHQRRRSSTKLSSDSSSPSRHGSPQRQSHSPLLYSCQSPMREPAVAAARQSPMRESVAAAARQSPMREPVVAVRRSPMREPVAAVRRSPMMRDSVVAARQSPMRDSVRPRQPPVCCDSVPESNKDSSIIEYRRHSRSSAPENTKNRIYVSSSLSDRAAEKSDKKHKVLDTDAAGLKEGSRSKILLKIPRKNKAEEVHEERKGDESQEEGKTVVADEEAAEDAVPKTWNLRPRKPIYKSLNITGGPFRTGGSAMHESKAQSPHMNVNRPEATESSGAQKKEKRHRFSLALSREEVEEDIYAMTGSKAARRPKKRAKAVQKQLDTLFPGLWLALITPDSYKVCENLPKG